MNWRRIRSIIAKDVRSVTSNKMVLLPMIVVPLVMCAFIPAILIVLGLSLDMSWISGVGHLQKLLPEYSIPESLVSLPEKLLYLVLNYSFLPMLMLVPLMASSVIAADSIVGEKERKTLETLLYSPVTNREFLTAKLLSAFLPSLGVSLIAFAGYLFIGNLLSYLLRGVLIIRSPILIPAVLLLSPSVSLLGLAVTLLVSLKARTYMEAQQFASIIVFPFVALIAVQISGALVFRAVYVVILSALLFAVSYFLIRRAAPRFTRENIINTL